MPTFAGYVADVLGQVKASYDVIVGLENKPGDLDTMKKECIKVDGLLRSLVKRIENSDMASDTYRDVLKHCRYYIENYSFDDEIETMSSLYANDPGRLKNIRLKILESFYDKKFIENIDKDMKKLEGM